eukprot:3940375-Rhodomonas_salina.8
MDFLCALLYSVLQCAVRSEGMALACYSTDKSMVMNYALCVAHYCARASAYSAMHTELGYGAAHGTDLRYGATRCAGLSASTGQYMATVPTKVLANYDQGLALVALSLIHI